MSRAHGRRRVRTALAAAGITLLGYAASAGPVTQAPFTDSTTSGVSITATTSFIRASMTTVAGGPGSGAATAVGMHARMISRTASGDVLVADVDNSVVRRWNPATSALTLVAGVGAAGYLAAQDGGQATAAMLNQPQAAVEGPGGVIYIADTGNNCIRAVSTGGVITTFAGQCGTAASFAGDGGAATAARFSSPRSLDVDASGLVYVADTFNQRVRVVALDGTITTVAGPGTPPAGGTPCADAAWDIPATSPPTDAAIGNVNGVAVSGSTVYVTVSHRLLAFTVGGTLTTVLGTACGSQGFNNPRGVDVEADGSVLVADTNGQVVRRVTNGVATTVCNGYQTWGVAATPDGTIYVSDFSNQQLKSCVTGTSTAVAGVFKSPTASGDGAAATTALVNPSSNSAQLAWSGGTLYLGDTGNNRVRSVSGGTIATVAGTGTAGYSGNGGAATSATFRAPAGVAVSGATLYLSDTGNHRIRKVVAGVTSLVAGTGTAGSANDADATLGTLSSPGGVAVHAGELYVADTGSNLVRKIVDGGAMTTVAGTGAAGYSGDGAAATAATFRAPVAVAVAADGTVYVADTGNHAVRAIATDGAVTTVAGTGTAGASGDAGAATAATLSSPSGLALGPAGELYIADTGNNRIRVVRSGIISTFAGGTATGFTGDSLATYAITLSGPRGLVCDTSTGDLYVVDAGNRRIRRLTTPP